MVLFSEDIVGALGKRSYRTSSISILILICAFIGLTTANSNEAAAVGERTVSHQHSAQSNSNVQVLGPDRHAPTLHQLFTRLQRSSASRAPGDSPPQSSNAADGEQRTCVIEVPEIRRVPGRCIRLMGGTSACRSDEFLDPLNEACA